MWTFSSTIHQRLKYFHLSLQREYYKANNPTCRHLSFKVRNKKGEKKKKSNLALKNYIFRLEGNFPNSSPLNVNLSVIKQLLP